MEQNARFSRSTAETDQLYVSTSSRTLLTLDPSSAYQNIKSWLQPCAGYINPGNKVDMREKQSISKYSIYGIALYPLPFQITNRINGPDNQWMDGWVNRCIA